MKQSPVNTEFVRFERNSVLAAILLSALFLVYASVIVELRSDHIQLWLICLIGYFAHPQTRRFVTGFSIFIVYWVIYDSMKAYPNYWFNKVHIQEPYEFEKLLFGISSPQGVLTPNEYFLANGSTFLDVLTGFFYINWMPIPLLFALFLWFKDKFVLLQFSAAFFVVNLVGFVIYYTYPAAPPWYVQLYGFAENFNIPSNVAGLIKFDEYFGISVFQDIYSKGSNVFAAIPSLHSAYPVVVLFYAIKKKLGWVNIFFATFVLGIWFSAVYTSHHYIIDVVLGAACAAVGLAIFEGYILKTRIGTFLERFSLRA